MKNVSLILTLFLLAGMAHATFEIADPANQIVKEQQESPEQQAEQKPFCEVNLDTGDCSCMNEESGQSITMDHYDCVSRASEIASEKAAAQQSG